MAHFQSSTTLLTVAWQFKPFCTIETEVNTSNLIQMLKEESIKGPSNLSVRKWEETKRKEMLRSHPSRIKYSIWNWKEGYIVTLFVTITSRSGMQGLYHVHLPRTKIKKRFTLNSMLLAFGTSSTAQVTLTSQCPT